MDYVLVHGTTQSAVGWERLSEALTVRGHRTVAVDLPVDRPELRAVDYGRLAAEQVEGMVANPVVVAHSGGGLLAPAIARELGARHLVWVGALVPDWVRGRSFTEELDADVATMFGPEWPQWTTPLTVAPAEDAYFLFHDCDLATLRWALSGLRYFGPRAVFTEIPEQVTLPPSTYVLPRQDRTLTPQWMRTAARERLGAHLVEVDGGHCPHVSRPDQLAAILHGLNV